MKTELVNTWTDNWLKMIDLINRVTGKSSPPTVAEQAEYTLLRSWFVENEMEFIPLWRDYQNRTIDSNDDNEEEECSVDPELNKYVINPFLYFYEPDNFYKLAVHLDLQSSDSVWEPEEEVMTVVRPFMVAIGNDVVHFKSWMENWCDYLDYDF